MSLNDPTLKRLTSPEPIARRDFLGMVIRCGLFATLAAMVFPSLIYIWPVTRSGPVGGMNDVGGVDDFPIWGSKKIILGGSAILVIRTEQGFKAFSATCTHLGCLVGWDDKRREIVCPCHAGVFNIEGNVVAGPPPRPLASYQVNVVNGRVNVKV